MVLSRQCCLSLLDYGTETGLVINCHISKHLAVQLDIGLVQTSDELAVVNTLLTACRIDTGNPQRAKYALACAQVTIRILAGLHDGLLGYAIDTTATATKALGFLENSLVAQTRIGTTFYSRHGWLLKR